MPAARLYRPAAVATLILSLVGSGMAPAFAQTTPVPQPAPAPKPATPQPPAPQAAPVPPEPQPAPAAGPAGGTQPAPSAATSPDVDPDMQRVAACKARALQRLKATSSSIDDIYLDIDGLTIASTKDGKVGETPVSGVIMGEAYIQRDRTGEPNRFLCLTGPKGEVLFTFFTER